MRLLVADMFPADKLEVLAAAGHRCRYQPELDGAGLAAALGDAEGLVVRSTKITAETVEAAADLRLIIRAGAGVNTIDVAAAQAMGIQVSNVPGRNAAAVAELVLGLIISIDRNIPDNVAELRAGHWDKKRFSEARGVKGRRLGIVGMGSVGLEVAARAVAFDMGVVAEAKPRPRDVEQRLAELGVELAPDLPALLGSCDVVSLHVPYSGGVLVDEEFLSHLKPGSMLINTARGELVDEEALLAALDDKGLRAGLDVFQGEPPAKEGRFESRLAQHPGVYGTHHIGASTRQAQDSVADEVIAIIEDFMNGIGRNVVEAM